MVMTMNKLKNKVTLDTNTKPLPTYKVMDNSMNSLTLRARERINTNINHPMRVTQILPSITPTRNIVTTNSITPLIALPTPQPYMYNMLSTIHAGSMNCGSCGGSK